MPSVTVVGWVRADKGESQCGCDCACLGQSKQALLEPLLSLSRSLPLFYRGLGHSALSLGHPLA